MRNKYQNIKTCVNGIEFDSRKEARRYQELLLLQRAGVIRDLELQKKFELVPTLRESSTERYVRGAKKGQFKDGKVIEQGIYYIADFVYREGENLIVEDTKGIKTKEYIIKRKLMLWIHGIRIREV